MFRRRAGWLSALFLGEMLTATAMAFFEDEIARAVVLALFVPLIISSGGNSGSQASTLVMRAMALGEVRLADWWRVVRRELASGLALGSLLGAIGFLRIVIWQAVDAALRRALPAASRSRSRRACSGVVMFGTLAGSLLPFMLPPARRRPRERVGAVRRDARRRHRARDLLHRREPDPGGHAALMDAVVVASLVFAVTLLGALLGMRLRKRPARASPERRLEVRSSACAWG